VLFGRDWYRKLEKGLLLCRLEKEKPQFRGFSCEWPITGLPKSPRQSRSAGGKFRLRLVLVEPGLCSPDLKRGARGLLASLCVAGYPVISSYHAVLHHYCFHVLRSKPMLSHSGLWKPHTGKDSGIHRNLQP
jgi:hypothetical protein